MYAERLLFILLLVQSVKNVSSRKKMYALNEAPDPPSPDKLMPYKLMCQTCDPKETICFDKHPEDCDKFIQCFFDKKDHDTFIAINRRCDFGQYWDHDVHSCRDSTTVYCQYEKCRIPDLLSYPMTGTSNCRMFWWCNLLTSYGSCCPIGYRYDSYEGCVDDEYCNDPCPWFIHHEGPCNRLPDFDFANKYHQFVPGDGWVELECPEGSRFSAVMCDCSYYNTSTEEVKSCTPSLLLPFNGNFEDTSEHNTTVINKGVKLSPGGYAFFDGKSSLTIPKYRNFQFGTITIMIRFLALGKQKRLNGIMSNGITVKGKSTTPTLLMLKSQSNLHYMARSTHRRVTTFHMPIRKYNWNKVTYIHNGNSLEGITNEIVESDWNTGGIKPNDSPLTIGRAPGFKNFKGYIDEIMIFECRPRFL